MNCDQCRAALGPHIDHELTPRDQLALRRHVDACADCRRSLEEFRRSHARVVAALPRHRAPDALRARIVAAIAAAERAPVRRSPATRPGWWRLAAAALVVATASSLTTATVLRRATNDSALEEQFLSSHVRSLQPGHLTDVVSTDQHTVKPWFNGRVDLSPEVPDLSADGFALVGGRADYVNGRAVAVVVYARRRHLINVYQWPATHGTDASPKLTTRNGYQLVRWRSRALELWAVSDLNETELREFVAAFGAPYR
jgi:anti-sigma factor RsiW